MTRVFTVVAATLAGATLVGLVLLWPDHVESQLAEGVVVDSDKAEVEKVDEVICAGFAEQKCQDATVRLKSGPDAGKNVHIQLGATGALDPDLDPGDDIRVTEAPKPPSGAEPVAGTGYSLYDFERRGPMLLLAVLFAVVVLVFARLRGALSLAGLAISLAVLLLFVVPAILDGSSPLLVAVVGSLAVAFVTIPLAHGWGPKSVSAYSARPRASCLPPRSRCCSPT